MNSIIISTPSSSRKQDKQRDPDEHSTKKGTTWNFRYKAHIGVDKDSGIVQSVEVTSANVHDVEVTPKLLTCEKETIYGDSGYIGAEKREDAHVKNKNGKKSNTKPIINRPNTRANLIVPKVRSKEENA